MSKFEYWYPWYPVHFRRDTLHLTAEQDGIYRRLLDHYMESRQPLPDNDVALARIASVGIDNWKMAAAMLRPFFRQADGKLWHKKCDEILSSQDAYSQKQSVKGRKGALRKHGKAPASNKENSTSQTAAKPLACHGDGKGEERKGEENNNLLSESPRALGPVDNGDKSAPPENLNNFIFALPAFCRLLGKRELGKPDQETIARWCEAYDIREYVIPLLERRLPKYRQANSGKNPAQLSYFDQALREHKPANPIARDLAQKLKSGGHA